jgi:lipid II:glycine glycyltransferase (peptidoglycan interpeptide bridge formation enzyme)
MPKTEAQKKWIANNKEYYNEMQNQYVKKHYLNNREKKLAYAKEYREKNKEKILQDQKDRYKLKKLMTEINNLENELKETGGYEEGETDKEEE